MSTTNLPSLPVPMPYSVPRVAFWAARGARAVAVRGLAVAFLPDLATRQFLLKNLYRNDSGGFAWRMNLYGIVNQIENIGEESHGKTFLKPTLFIKGQNSTYIQEKDQKQMFELFPNAQLRTLKGAGHWVQAEKPKEFVEEVLGFLV